MVSDDVSLLVLVCFDIKQLHRLSVERKQFSFVSHDDFGRIRFGIRVVALEILVEVELPPEYGPSRFGARRTLALHVR